MHRSSHEHDTTSPAAVTVCALRSLLCLAVLAVGLCPRADGQAGRNRVPHDETQHPYCGTTPDLWERVRALPWMQRRLEEEKEKEEQEDSAPLRGAPGFDVGDDLTVLQDDGSLSFAGVSDSRNMVKAFLGFHYDDFDLVALYNDFGLRPESGFAHHTTVTNEVLGTGRALRDIAVIVGIPTQRLGGYVNVNSLTRYPPGPHDPVPALDPITTPVTILAHEVAHQWLSALAIEGFNLLGRGELHWSFYFDSPASVMEGNRWRDNGNGTFTTIEAFQRFGSLDQYSMGLRPPEQVATQLLVTMHPGGPTRFTFPRVGVTTPGVPHLFEIGDVIAKVGARVPAAADAPHSFRVATVLVVDGGAMPSAADLLRVNAFRVEYEHFFRGETDGRGAMRTRLRVPESRVVQRLEPPCSSARLGFSAAAEPLGGPRSDPLLVVGAPKAGPGCVLGYSGRDGRRLFRSDGAARGDNLGVCVALVPDRTGDGVPEVAAGAPGASVAGAPGSGRVAILDGSTGGLVTEYLSPSAGAGFGRSVAVAGDVDGNGLPELLVGASRQDGPAGADAGAAYLVSGETGSVLLRVDGADPLGKLGFAVAVPGDLDGDGVEDHLLGAPYAASGGGMASAGAVIASSGRDGTTIWRAEGNEVASFLGASLAVLGDLDGDGVLDVAVGEPGRSVRGRAGAGWVAVLSGADGGELLRIPGGGEAAAFGASVARVPDLEGDDRDELAVGSPGAHPGGSLAAGTVAIFSTRDGALLDWIEGDEPSRGLGSALAAVPSPGGVRLLCGAAGSRPAATGDATVHDVSYFRLSTRGAGALGSTLELRVAGGRPGERYAIIVSTRVGADGTPLPYPVGAGNRFALDVGLESIARTRTTPGFLGRLDGSGQAFTSLTLPSRAQLQGMQFHLQAVSLREDGAAPPAILRASPPVSLRLK